jgi:hypothetical protein
MSFVDTILGTLAKPDDQGGDWYLWASNQCAHALFGCILVLWGLGMGAAMLPFIIKEAYDFYKVPTWRTVKDSAVDLCFAGIGIIIAMNSYMGALFLIMALGIGVVTRIKLRP